MAYKTSQHQLLDFVREHRVVAESAKGLPVPSLVRYMVGVDYRGNWWALEDSSSLYNALQGLRDRDDVHVCKLAKGKVTFVHADALLPFLSRSAEAQPGARRPSDDRADILAAWQRSGGNKSRLAAMLGVSRKTLYARIKRLNIQLD